MLLFSGKKNSDLWKRFLPAFRKHKVKFVWVKGHAENTENNRCDELAVEASFASGLLKDEWYEKQVN
jgi:ribonuclease HI